MTPRTSPFHRLELGRRHVYDPETGILAVSDLHLDLPASTPSTSLIHRDIPTHIEECIENCEPERFILAGDVFHHSAGIPDLAYTAVDEMIATAQTHGAETIFVKGNHDSTGYDHLQETREDITIVESVDTDELCITHGHQMVDTDSELLVCGHVHPAIKHGGSAESCFLYDDEFDTIVLPAFNDAISPRVLDETHVETDCPFIDGRLGDCQPILGGHNGGRRFARLKTFW